ncbi:MAG: FKBP-type peptidyl-prolyl cis-trans isomerase [Bacteroidota bacterium]|nr:FKBP-type peptidyl-prolyl cis-trans isomerase [Bacteroidota bacterium]
MRSIIYILIILNVLFITGCNDKEGQKEKKGRISKEQLAEINRQLLIKDRERIKSYIERKGLEMKETATGLWYTEKVEGKGSINNGDKVALDYVCSLLDGTVVYDSQRDGRMHFEVGKSDIPSGLNEGIKLLGEGSEAVLIMPGYLGYGLLGDKNKIPSRSILVYRIKVVEVN